MGGYARMKVERDWIYAQLCERIPPGARVLDLGAGMGLLGLVLEERKQGHAVHGIEWDDRKVAFARRLALSGSACQVHQGDILKDPWPPSDIVVLVDVLHYFPEQTQKELLHRIAHHLESGGMLLMRVMDREAKGRAWLTRLMERLAVSLKWNRAPDLHWRGIREILADLSAAGLQPTLGASDSRLLDGNCLVIASKP